MRQSVYHAEAWTDTGDQWRYVPTAEEHREAAQLFGEPEDLQAEFDEFLASLPDHDFVAITRAIDEIRRVLRQAWRPLSLPVLASWLDTE